jgi:formate dehydrogenase subunit delta
MNVDHLIKMANEISAFFAAEPDKEQAARDVASHIRRFWEVRMRKEIVEHYRRGAGGLDDLARAAIALIAAESASGKTGT